MTTPIFRKSTYLKETSDSVYGQIGLSRNPFPSRPSVVIGSPNPVENGSIYLEKLHEKERNRFEELLIPKPDKPFSRTIAFLMDYATPRGRGIGKTSFLFHQSQRIMKDLGYELSEGSQVMFGVYVLPISGDETKFWQFTKLLFDALVDNRTIATAIWRLRAFSGAIPDKVLEEVGDEPEETIGSDHWLSNKGVDVFMHLPHLMETTLLKLGISSELAKALSRYGGSTVEFQKNYVSRISNVEWRKDGGKILFDDLVKVFMAAGFNKGIFLCDGVERIIQSQNAKERRDFAESVRYFFVDGQCENTRNSFFSLLLTLHPYSQELLSPHWIASGLDRFATLSGGQEADYTIYIHPLQQDSAKALAMIYLNAARLKPTKKETLAPFTEKGLEGALIAANRVPGKFLNLLHLAVEKAIEMKWDKIDSEQIKIVIDARGKTELDKPDGLDSLPPTQINMRE